MILLGIASMGGALAYYFYQEAALIRSWTFNVVGLNLLSYTSTNSNLEVTLKIVNVSNIEATITNLTGTVTINGTYMGTIGQIGALNIPSNGWNNLNLTINLDNQNLVNTIVNIGAQGAQAPVVITVVGSATINSGLLGISVPINDTENDTLQSLLQP